MYWQRAENAWKPGDKGKGDLPEDEKEREELLKTFRGMLNKITPQKFQTILAKVINQFYKIENLSGFCRSMGFYIL